MSLTTIFQLINPHITAQLSHDFKAYIEIHIENLTLWIISITSYQIKGLNFSDLTLNNLKPKQ